MRQKPGRKPMALGTWGRISASVLPDGQWRARARMRTWDGQVRKISRNGKTKSKAEARLLEALQELRGILGGLAADTTFGEAVEEWLQARKLEGTLSDSTHRAYTSVARRAVLPQLGQIWLNELSPSVTLRALEQVRNAHPGTYKTARSIVSQVCRRLVLLNMLPMNPALSAPRQRRPVVKGKLFENAYDAADFRDLLLQWSSEHHLSGNDGVDAFDLLIVTGARISEVLALRWIDLKLTDEVSVMKLTGALVEIQGVGHVRSEVLKTASSRRNLVLPKAVAHGLIERKLRHRARDYDFVFPGRTGRTRTPGTIRSYWLKAAAGTSYTWVTPHALRRTVATQVAKKHGVTAASQQLGHSSIAVTERHYINLGTDVPDFTDAVEGFNFLAKPRELPTLIVLPVDHERRRR